MTVNEFFKYYCKNDLKVMSGYNGKILCKRFNPKKHVEIGKREIVAVWAEIETEKQHGFGYKHYATPIICAYAEGYIEYEKERLAKKGGESDA